jgi:hypothetical protein
VLPIIPAVHREDARLLSASKELGHQHGCAVWLHLFRNREAAALVKPHRIDIDMGVDASAAMNSRKLFGLGEQLAPVTPTLSVLSHCHTPKDRNSLIDNVYSNDSESLVGAPQNEGVISRSNVVGVVCIVCIPAATTLKQDATADLMVDCPFGFRRGTPQIT